MLMLAACSARQAMPGFDYTRLDGTKASSAELRGKVVLVEFWATSCPICVAEMPQVIAAHRRFRARGFETLAVAMNYDAPANVADFAETRQLPFPVVIDNTGAIAARFPGIEGTPTRFVVDRQGAIVKRYVGKTDFAELDALIERLLAQA